MLMLKMATSPYLILRTIPLAKAMFQAVSVATLLTYKHNNVRLDGRSMSMEKTLERKAGAADTVKMLKWPRSLLSKQKCH